MSHTLAILAQVLRTCSFRPLELRLTIFPPSTAKPGRRVMGVMAATAALWNDATWDTFYHLSTKQHMHAQQVKCSCLWSYMYLPYFLFKCECLSVHSAFALLLCAQCVHFDLLNHWSFLASGGRVGQEEQGTPLFKLFSAASTQ